MRNNAKLVENHDIFSNLSFFHIYPPLCLRCYVRVEIEKIAIIYLENIIRTRLKENGQ